RRLRPDDNEVDAELSAEREQPLRVARADRMAFTEARDPGVPGRGMKCLEPRALRELPGERVLATAGPNDQDPHAPSLLRVPERALGPLVRFARPPPRGDRNRELRTCLSRDRAESVPFCGGYAWPRWAPRMKRSRRRRTRPSRWT